MITYTYGDKHSGGRDLDNTDEYIVVRSRHPRKRFDRNMFTKHGQEVLSKLQRVFSFPDAGVEILGQGTISAKDACADLKKETTGLRFAGRALAHPVHRAPSVYTENLFIRLEDDCRTDISEITGRVGLAARKGSRPIGPNRAGAPQAYFIKTPLGTGQ